MTAFLPAELTEMGLMAAADPSFAARLVDALQRLPAAQDACGPATSMSDSAQSNVELAADLR
jgi:hypothetical protein